MSSLGQQILSQANDDGYLVLKELAQIFNPHLLKDKTSIMPSHPLQPSSYSNYCAEAKLFYNLQGWVFNNVFDFGNHNYQNTFIAHLQHSSQVKEIAERE